MYGHYMPMSVVVTIAYAESIQTIPENLKEVKPTVLTSVPLLFEKVYAQIRDEIDQGSAIKRKIFNWAVSIGAERYERYLDRKSTRLNSSHVASSYAVFCLKKKKIQHTTVTSSKIGACQDLDTVWINSQIKTDLTNKINVPTREQAADIDEYESKHEQGYGW